MKIKIDGTLIETSSFTPFIATTKPVKLEIEIINPILPLSEQCYITIKHSNLSKSVFLPYKPVITLPTEITEQTGYFKIGFVYQTEEQRFPTYWSEPYKIIHGTTEV